MSSFLFLELDTTAPILTLKVPRRTIPENVIEITITASEQLGTFQEIYIIDSGNNRHDYIFNRVESNKYLGFIDFQSMPLGITTFYCRFKDDVDNISELYSSYINVGYIPYKYECVMDMTERDSELNMIERDNSIMKLERTLDIDFINRSTNINIIKRDCKMEVV